MADWFPSREWLESYRTNLNEDDTYEAESDGWGVEFNGDFLFVLTRLPLEETTLEDLPDELTTDLFDRIDALEDDEFECLRETATPAFDERLESTPEEGGDERERFQQTLSDVSLAEVPDLVWPELEAYLRGDLESLLNQLETYVVDDTRVHAYVELEDGDCQRAELVEEPSARDPGFELEAPYETWTELVEGADVIESVMSNEMALDGEITRVLHYGDAAGAMGDVAGETDARYLF